LHYFPLLLINVISLESPSYMDTSHIHTHIKTHTHSTHAHTSKHWVKRMLLFGHKEN